MLISSVQTDIFLRCYFGKSRNNSLQIELIQLLNLRSIYEARSTLSDTAPRLFLSNSTLWCYIYLKGQANDPIAFVRWRIESYIRHKIHIFIYVRSCMYVCTYGALSRSAHMRCCHDCCCGRSQFWLRTQPRPREGTNELSIVPPDLSGCLCLCVSLHCASAIVILLLSEAGRVQYLWLNEWESERANEQARCADYSCRCPRRSSSSSVVAVAHEFRHKISSKAHAIVEV